MDLNYLNKFNRLDDKIRKKIGSQQATSKMDELSKKFNIGTLYETVMKVAIQDIKINDLTGYLMAEFNLNNTQANELKQTLIDQIFQPVLKYLKPNQDASSDLPIQNPVKIESFDLDEDELDIQQVTENILPAVKIVPNNLDKIALEISVKSGLNLTDEVFKNRFISIIVSRLKEVRDDRQILDKMMRDRKVGGLNLNEQEARRVLELIQQEIKNRQSEIEQAKKEEPTLSTITSQEEQLVKRATVGFQPKAQEQSQLSPRAQFTDKELNKKNKMAFELPSEIKKQMVTQPVLSARPVVSEIKPTTPTVKRPSLESIRLVKSKIEKQSMPIVSQSNKFEVVGPIDELQKIDLNTFRSLTNTAEQSAQKIKEKIKILGQDSLEQEARAIEAWYKSDIIKMYLSLGQESIKQKKPIETILAEKSGEQNLTLEEFKVINNLNNELEF
ncbi:MAG: hypothetical protein PHS07_03930 [Patescibacteria group bacterium]|nr:hypothetical protein [Patescibacteria group bacterium]